MNLIENIIYHPDAGEHGTMDLYRPDRQAGCPVVVAVHGGGWSAGGKEQQAPLANALVRAGIACAAVNHRLAPQYRYPIACHDPAAGYWSATASATSRTMKSRGPPLY